ncbi:hypothetical protein HYP85_gp071 [Pseudomonas phage Zuri]|uniref:Uncharacterized protein n=1 Tax=Pseudomonas phage Zuri TaxID=2604899 RepID=A0A5C1K6R7_9CAUD|nr:hypothetical protein HYP85_gp071 [Pseudomonas phage Zuri]QEM41096.1 hypothetical protein Zuri_102 [Pseudomonas phage Zuri]
MVQMFYGSVYTLGTTRIIKYPPGTLLYTA